MVTYRCSRCGQWSDFTPYYDEVVQSEKITCMTHVLIPTKFHKCGHMGVFRWDRKSFIQLCKLQGIKPKIKEA